VSVSFSHILDTSALLAALLNEPGNEQVFTVLDSSAISSVNLLETFGKLVQKGIPAAEARQAIESLALPVIEWGEEDVWASADTLSLAWQSGISMGDRICLVTARKYDAVALTADRKWIGLVPGVKIQLIR
jgi:PIN domain nuclease of toxin-antitoxin system